MRALHRLVALAVVFCLPVVVACSNSKTSSTSQSSSAPGASPAATAAASAAASPTATASGAAAQPAPTVSAYAVSYTDLSGVFGAQQITDLAKLGVFGTPSGKFNPSGTITRGDFTRWLVNANNAIWADDTDKQIRPASGGASAYPDVSSSHPDFSYIQGLHDSGFAVGFPDKTFKPDEKLTHEQMIAIKEALDRGGVDKYYVSFWDATMPHWKDRDKINKMFRPAIAEDGDLDRVARAQSQPAYVIDNVGRSFGAIAMFDPQQPVTRAQAALVLWKIGAHVDQRAPQDLPRSAADALAPPTPTPSP